MAQACEERDGILEARMIEIADAATPQTLVEAKREIAAIQRRLGRLWRRPGEGRAG